MLPEEELSQELTRGEVPTQQILKVVFWQTLSQIEGTMPLIMLYTLLRLNHIGQYDLASTVYRALSAA